ncbi:MAG: hypothetical protein GY943_26050 [Chloroflexi bacterium]|nr:hypothetical protein [Chloroflexota bacterium]
MGIRPRILLYQPDESVGVLQQTVAFAQQLRRDLPDAQLLLLLSTSATEQLPSSSWLDYLFLPSINNNPDPPQFIKRQREQQILNATLDFKPHIFIVHQNAAGKEGELLPTLRFVKNWSPQTKFVFGMTDISALPQEAKVSWQVDGILQLLDEVYDLILFFGQRELFNPVFAHEMPVSTAVKIIECGYQHINAGKQAENHAISPIEKEKESPLVLISLDLTKLEALVSWLNSYPYVPPASPIRLVYVKQTEVGQPQEDTLKNAFQDIPIVTVSKGTSYYKHVSAQADLLLGDASYATVCELLPAQTRFLMLVTLFSSPDNLLRAQQFSQVGWGRIVHEEGLSWHALWDEIFTYLQSGRPSLPPKVDGIRRGSEAIATLFRTHEFD